MTAAAELLADPRHLLHRIDPTAGTATFMSTDKARLTRPSFIDGRSDFSVAPPVVVPLEALLSQDQLDAPGSDRVIFHVAFCGSTLLARLLEQDGAAHVLREPNVLVDLANWKRAGVDARFAPSLRLVMASLRRRWVPTEAAVVKASNWPNNLIVDLAALPGLLSLVITIPRRAYAVAVLRGGRERLAFAARTAAHLAPSLPQGEAWLQSAIATTADPVGRAVNLAVAAWHMQIKLFDPLGDARLDFGSIVDAPAKAASRAGRLLDLALDMDKVAADAEIRAMQDAKRPGHAYSARRRAREDAEVERHHGARIDAALAWADQTLT